MAGRNRIPSNFTKLREAPLLRPAVILHPRANDPLHHPKAVEDRLLSRHREIQALFHDNQRLAATHVALKQELASSQQELRRLEATAADIKGERDVQIREVYERLIGLEAEVRAVDAMGSELGQVRADVKRLKEVRDEMEVELKKVEGEIERTRTEAKRVPDFEADIETMRREIQRGRAAIEYEKKTHASNLEQSQAMEKNMLSMAREIEKLRAELANAEKRARAAAAASAAANPAAGYASDYGNSDMMYGGSPYPDPRAHQVHVGVDAVSSQYGSGAALPTHYDVQRSYAQR